MNQRRPPLQVPRAFVSYHSSQAQNSHDEEDEAEAESEEDGLRDSTVPEDVLASLNEMFTMPGLENYNTVISSTLEPETTWYVSHSLSVSS